MAIRRIPSRRNPVQHAKRRAVAARRFDAQARCACGESRPEALVEATSPVLCHECQRSANGQSQIDAHHFAGRANDGTTVPVPTNEHVAALSERQRDWPRETLENPSGDPLLRGAACIRGFVDYVTHLIANGVLWVAEMLERLSTWLKAHHGERWWIGTPLDVFIPTR